MVGKKKATGERGFTLIELMIVVAVLGILAAVFIPIIKDGAHTVNRMGCLSFGYPQTEFYGGTAYCVRRISDSDEVVELAKLREEHTAVESAL